MIDKYFETRISEISNQIIAGNNQNKEFSEYLGKICNLPDKAFSLQNWPQTWRDKIYEFGKIFKQKDASIYLIELKPYIRDENLCEIAAFIYSEIIWNYFESNNDYNKDILKSFIDKFLHNPEFHHTYGHFLLNNKTYDKAIFEYQRALIIDKNNFHFLNSYIIGIKVCFEHYVSGNHLESAEKFLTSTINHLKAKGIFNIPIVGSEIKGITQLMEDRLRDHKTIAKQVDYFKKEIENTIKIEQRRLIEVIGIFSGILAFILTNITISLSNLGIKEMLILMFGMGLVLIIFSLSISYIFGPRQRYGKAYDFLKKSRFWAIVVLLVLSFLLLKFSEYI